jgi:hypothetical protein
MVIHSNVGYHSNQFDKISFIVKENKKCTLHSLKIIHIY